MHSSNRMVCSSEKASDQLNSKWLWIVACWVLGLAWNVMGEELVLHSPNGRNAIHLDDANGEIHFSVHRDQQVLMSPSRMGLELATAEPPLTSAQPLQLQAQPAQTTSATFRLPWGKAAEVRDSHRRQRVAIRSGDHVVWEVELHAADDGVAFRYHLPAQAAATSVEIRDDQTEFRWAGEPRALYNTLASFTTSHESLYEFRRASEIPLQQLCDAPLLLVWPDGPAAAITEARVRDFAGMYLRREKADENSLRCRLSPAPGRPGISVTGDLPLVTPWRVVLLADHAGQLHESSLLLALNDAPQGDFTWAQPGKTTFHWWYGEFENDYQLGPHQRQTFVARHKAYIDFCARHGIAYHAVSGDGRAWYPQSSLDYGVASADADVRRSRSELGLPEILAYAQQNGVRIRLWVHWKALEPHLEEAFAKYEQWGVAGLMVDFLDRDDQEMIEFTERLLAAAARHKLHIQIHGSSKYSGEQRTFPHLFNREGVLNLEYLKWSDTCTPQHSVNVAYTRALAGPVDYHSGGFRAVSRAAFQPQMVAPTVLGTRAHHLGLFVVFENPLPMLADAPAAYEGQTGFDFLREVPTTWDETRFVAGEVGEYLVLARRRGNRWYLGGINNWSAREIDVPLSFLPAGSFASTLYADASQDESRPNEVSVGQSSADATTVWQVSLAPGGGFTAVLTPESDSK